MLRTTLLLLLALASTEGVGVAAFQKPNARSHNAPLKPDCEIEIRKAREYEVTDDPKAEVVFRLAQSIPGCHIAFRELTFNLAGKLKFREAAESLTEYVKLEPGERERFSKTERELSIGSQIQARVESTEQPTVEDLIELTQLAAAYGNRHGWDAVRFAERAVNLYPKSVPAKLQLARLMLVTRDLDRAGQILDEALTLEPENVNIYAAMGSNYLFGRMNLGKAASCFQKALMLSNDEDLDSWRGLGKVYKFMGRRYEALTAFRQYLKRAINDKRTTDADIAEVKSLIAELGDVP